jgi:cytoskeleton protein RodZ
MTLSELGQKLKQEREAQGITLEQIQQKTKISLHILKAIEEGNTSLLPHPVYVKGFVQDYARNLGLDWKEIGEQFANLYRAEDKHENLEELPTSLKAKLGGGRTYRCSKIIALSVLGITLVVLVWLAVSSFFSSEKDVQKIEKNSPLLEEKQGNDTALVQNGSGIINDFESQNASTLMFNAGNETNETVVNENATEVKETEESKNTTLKIQNDVVKKGENSTFNKHETAIQQKTVIVMAVEPCWFEITKDGIQKEFYLRPGGKVILTFTKFLRLRLGNAGGVKLKYNGQDYPIQARSGQVKTLYFGQP